MAGNLSCVAVTALLSSNRIQASACIDVVVRGDVTRRFDGRVVSFRFIV